MIFSSRVFNYHLLNYWRISRHLLFFLGHSWSLRSHVLLQVILKLIVRVKLSLFRLHNIHLISFYSTHWVPISPGKVDLRPLHNILSCCFTLSLIHLTSLEDIFLLEPLCLVHLIFGVPQTLWDARLGSIWSWFLFYWSWELWIAIKFA